MEMLCPECLNPLKVRDGKTALCSRHGEFRILFMRGQQVTLPSLQPSVAVGGEALPDEQPEPPDLVTAVAVENPYRAPDQQQQVCSRHPHTPTQHNCAVCETAVCMVCAFPQPNGTLLCPDCVLRSRPTRAVPQEVPEGVMCSRHPEVQAVYYCRCCRQPTCATCDFTMPGDVHVCPECATRTDQRLSPGRKKLLGWAFALAIWCTLGLAVMLSGVLAQALAEPGGEEALGALLWIVVYLPAMIGTALSFSAFDRRLRNPPVMWVAAIWNTLILAVLILLTIVGLMMP